MESKDLSQTLLHYSPGFKRFYFLNFLLSLALATGIQSVTWCQQPPPNSLKVDSLRIRSGKAPRPAENIHLQYDVGDLFQDIVHPNKHPDSLHKRSGTTVIPNIAANPTIGFQIGIKAVAGLKLGHDPKTLMSVAATSVSVITKGIIYFYISHNIFTNANKWNLQGSLVAAKSVTPDFGLGIGHGAGKTSADSVLTNPGRKGRVLHSFYYIFREKVYRELLPNFFMGAGVSFEIRRKIDEGAAGVDALTPYNIYNARYVLTRIIICRTAFS